MATIQLIPAAQEIPVATEQIPAATTEETPPTRKGRGRPPGAKNKPKAVKPLPVPPPEEEPQQPDEPEEPEEQEEQEEP